VRGKKIITYIIVWYPLTILNLGQPQTSKCPKLIITIEDVPKITKLRIILTKYYLKCVLGHLEIFEV